MQHLRNYQNRKAQGLIDELYPDYDSTSHWISLNFGRNANICDETTASHNQMISVKELIDLYTAETPEITHNAPEIRIQGAVGLSSPEGMRHSKSSTIPGTGGSANDNEHTFLTESYTNNNMQSRAQLTAEEISEEFDNIAELLTVLNEEARTKASLSEALDRSAEARSDLKKENDINVKKKASLEAEVAALTAQNELLRKALDSEQKRGSDDANCAIRAAVRDCQNFETGDLCDIHAVSGPLANLVIDQNATARNRAPYAVRLNAQRERVESAIKKLEKAVLYLNARTSSASMPETLYETMKLIRVWRSAQHDLLAKLKESELLGIRCSQFIVDFPDFPNRETLNMQLSYIRDDLLRVRS